MNFFKNKSFFYLFIFAIIVLISFLFLFFDPFKSLRLKVLDNYYVMDQSKKVSDDVVIIAIDDKSLRDENFGRWHNWTRRNYGQLLDVLKEYKPKVIAFDVSFTESSSGISPDEFMKLYKDSKTIEDILPYFDTDKTNPEDIYFAQSIKNIRASGTEVILATEVKPTENLYPVESIGIEASALGFANVDPDIDDVIRKVPLFYIFKTEDGDFINESLFLMTYRYYKGIPFTEDDFIFPNKYYKNGKYIVGDKEILLNGLTQMNINYFAVDGNTYSNISFSDAINKKFVDQRGKNIDLKDKIIFVGATAPALQDLRSTPISRGVLTPGVEVHTSALQTLLDGRFLYDVPWYYNLLILVFLYIIIFIIKKFFNISIWYFFLLLFVLSIMYYLFTVFMFNIGIVFDVFYFYLLFVLLYIIFVSYDTVLHIFEKNYLKSAFSKYVNKNYVEKIIKSPHLLKLGGERKEITIFFSDIVGFTTISEKIDSEILVHLLNEYLTAMTDMIFRYEGTLDKYIGDAIMAFWNAPLDIQEHAVKACDFAVNAMDCLDDLNKKWVLKNLPQLKIRSGINTDNVIVGNMGSLSHFNYTLIGDGVNLASRLEGANKEYNTSILIGENTYEKIKGVFITREIDTIKAKGKDKPVKIYNIGKRVDISSDKSKIIFKEFDEALCVYKSRDFEKAMCKFEDLVSKYDDNPSKTYINRCKDYIQNPPPNNWDFVYIMKSK